MQKVFLASDHGGFHLKEKIKEHLKKKGIEVVNLGPFSLDPEDDYPFYALELALRVKEEGGKGVLFCRSGIGMSIVANKVEGIRAGDVFNAEMARTAVEHNACQIISLPADHLSEKEALEIVEAFLTSHPFGAERHRKRVEEISRWETKRLEVIPALLEENEEDFRDKIERLKKTEITRFHLDVLTPPFEGRSVFDPELFSGFEIEVHLMGKEVPYDILRHKEVKRFVWQVEFVNREEFLKLKERGFIMGVSLDVDSPLDLLDPYLLEVEFFQIMGVKAGRAGQVFQKEVLKKIQALRERTEKEIVVDGGIDYVTSQLVKMAGADRVVSKTYLFGGDITERIKKLQ